MRQYKRIIFIIALTLSSIVLIACGNNKPSELENAKERLTYETILNENATKDSVVSDLNLFTNDGNVKITWNSSNTSVIKNTGEVIRTSSNVTVNLTATLELDSDKTSKVFEITVL